MKADLLRLVSLFRPSCPMQTWDPVYKVRSLPILHAQEVESLDATLTFASSYPFLFSLSSSWIECFAIGLFILGCYLWM